MDEPGEPKVLLGDVEPRDGRIPKIGRESKAPVVAIAASATIVTQIATRPASGAAAHPAREPRTQDRS